MEYRTYLKNRSDALCSGQVNLDRWMGQASGLGKQDKGITLIPDGENNKLINNTHFASSVQQVMCLTTTNYD